MSAVSFQFYLRCLTTIEKKIVPRNEANNRFISEYLKAFQGKKDSSKQAMQEAVNNLKVFEKKREEILNNMSYAALVSSQMWQEDKISFDDEAQWWHQMAIHHDDFKNELLVIHWRRERSENVVDALKIAFENQTSDKDD